MTTADSAIPAADKPQTRTGYPASSVRFDTIAIVLCGWFIFGMFLDGWAHNHARVDNTFFTPWHAVLYSGFASLGLFLVGSHFRNVMKGYAWVRALPAGYMPALAGILIFGLAGVSDFGWHSLFGFEVDLEALLSPAHLALATGSFLFLTGPVRSYWSRREQPQGWREMLPLILALAFVVNLLTFFTQYTSLAGDSSPMTGFRPGDDWFYDIRGTVGAIMHTALLTGMILLVIRRWRFPFGAFTLIFAINMALMMWMISHDTREFLLILPLALGGLVADGLLRWLKPSFEQPNTLRLFAFLVPFITALAFFITLNQVGVIIEGRGLWWAIHMWLGVPFVAGIAGFLLSLLAAPPAVDSPVSTITEG